MYTSIRYVKGFHFQKNHCTQKMGQMGPKLRILIFSWLLNFTLVVKVPQFCLNWPQNATIGFHFQKNHCSQKMGQIGPKLTILIFSWFFHCTFVIKLPHFCLNEVQNPQTGHQSQNYCNMQKISSIGAKLTILSTSPLSAPHPMVKYQNGPQKWYRILKRSLDAKNQPLMSKTVENAPKWLLPAFF